MVVAMCASMRTGSRRVMTGGLIVRLRRTAWPSCHGDCQTVYPGLHLDVEPSALATRLVSLIG